MSEIFSSVEMNEKVLFKSNLCELSGNGTVANLSNGAEICSGVRHAVREVRLLPLPIFITLSCGIGLGYVAAA